MLAYSKLIQIFVTGHFVGLNVNQYFYVSFYRVLYNTQHKNFLSTLSPQLLLHIKFLREVTVNHHNY